MAKGDQEKLNEDIDAQKKKNEQNTTGFLSSQQNKIGTPAKTLNNGYVEPATGLLGQQQQQLSQVTPQFQNFAGTGGVSDQTNTDLSTGQGSISSKLGAKIGDAENLTFGTNGSVRGMLTPNDYSQSEAGYRGLAATGGIDPTQARSTFSALQTGTGRADQDIINSLKDTTGRFGDVNDSISKLKGVDFSGVDSSINRLSDFSTTGGMDQGDKDNVMRELFKTNEQTGGYTPEQLANIKKESNSSVSGFYTAMQDQLARSRASSGGYGGGFSAANQALARQGAVASGDQALKTDVNLAESVRQGKMDAATKLQQGQLGISGITTPAKLAALQSAGQLGLGETGQKSSNLNNAGQLGLGATGQQISALESAGDLSRSQGQLQLAAAQGDLNAQRAIQEGKVAGLSGLTGITDSQAKDKLARASLTSNNALGMLGAQTDQAKIASSNTGSLAQMTQQGKEFGTSGLASLYNSTNQQLSDADRNYLAGLGLDANSQEGLLAIQQRNAMQPGKNQQMFGNIMQGVGTAAGAIRGFGG